MSRVVVICRHGNTCQDGKLPERVVVISPGVPGGLYLSQTGCDVIISHSLYVSFRSTFTLLYFGPPRPVIWAILVLKD